MRNRSPSPAARPRRQQAGRSGSPAGRAAAAKKPPADVEGGTPREDPDAELGLSGDYLNLVLLLVLYTLQGIPMGLAGSIPYILAEKGADYTEQAQFSLCSWPFALKLFWAPIVDSVYSESFGRRKTWLVPTQFAIAAIMLVGGSHADRLLAEEDPSQPADIKALTALFFSLFFLCATQDIAVDGWALTMLARRNVGHASTTNAVGQSLGFFIAFTGFLGLKAKDLCTLGTFMSGWGWVFLVTTVIIWLGKKESPTPDDEQPLPTHLVYKQMWDVLNLEAVRRLLLIMSTWKMGFAAGDAISALKLMEHGLPKEHMATISAMMTPVMMLLPMVVSSPIFERYTGMSTAGKRPLSLIATIYSPRLLLGVASAAYVSYVSDVFPLAEGAETPYLLYGLLAALSTLGAVFMTMMFVAQMAFFARVADPAIGGTYMTLLNTITNLGGMWPSTVVLYLVDPLTTRACLLPGGAEVAEGGVLEEAGGHVGDGELHQCNANTTETVPMFQTQACTEAGGSCVITTDGYYSLIAGCFVIGVFWVRYFKSEMAALEDLPVSGANSAWRVKTATASTSATDRSGGSTKKS